MKNYIILQMHNFLKCIIIIFLSCSPKSLTDLEEVTEDKKNIKHEGNVGHHEEVDFNRVLSELEKQNINSRIKNILFDISLKKKSISSLFYDSTKPCFLKALFVEGSNILTHKQKINAVKKNLDDIFKSGDFNNQMKYGLDELDKKSHLNIKKPNLKILFKKILKLDLKHFYTLKMINYDIDLGNNSGAALQEAGNFELDDDIVDYMRIKISDSRKRIVSNIYKLVSINENLRNLCLEFKEHLKKLNSTEYETIWSYINNYKFMSEEIDFFLMDKN